MDVLTDDEILAEIQSLLAERRSLADDRLGQPTTGQDAPVMTEKQKRDGNRRAELDRWVRDLSDHLHGIRRTHVP